MNYMYHVTTKKNFVKIMKGKGIKQKFSWFNLLYLRWDRPKAVYLSKNPIWIQVMWQNQSYWNPTLRFEDFVILKINVDGLALEREYEFPSAYLFRGNVSKCRIKEVFYMEDFKVEYELKNGVEVSL